jgi:hypothetical protein
MSFFKALKNKMTPPKASVWLKLDKSSFVLGEDAKGFLTVTSEEDFGATEIRCEINCLEQAKRMKHVYDERLHVHVDRQLVETETLYAGKPTVSGPIQLNKGYSGKFQFSINIPAGCRPTYKSVDDTVTWSVKGVIAVDGRPDVTSTVAEIQVLQPSAAPSGPVVKEVIREVVMIPCKYCGSLMPQTETACPNCGAKRTS